MKKCLVIPTYWGPINDNEEVIFDHPTGFEDEGTLKATLEDLEKFPEIKSGEIEVLIIAVANKASLWRQTENRVIEYVKPFEDKMKISVFSESWFKEIRNHQCLELKTVSTQDFDDILFPSGYSQARNLCLLAAIQSNADTAVFLDDDELVPDLDFFDRASYKIGEKASDNGVIHGKAGYYDQERPNFRWHWQLKWWPKDLTFNQMFDSFMFSDQRLNSTMVALGGNMVMDRELMSNICFDPEIHRGEDMDYVFNARLLGYRFYFDNKLKILHRPPEKKTPMWKKTREDIFRFLYLRSKYRAHLKSPFVQKTNFEEFQPYPGVFMQDDLDDRILEHMKMLGIKFLADGDRKAYETCMESASLPFEMKIDESKLIEKLLSRIDVWKKITSNI